MVYVWVGRGGIELVLVSELFGMLVKVILFLLRMFIESMVVGVFFVLLLYCIVSWYVGLVVKLNVGELV